MAVSGLPDDQERRPEMRMNRAVLLDVFFASAASGIGTIGFVWATVVLLGGFETNLNQVHHSPQLLSSHPVSELIILCLLCGTYFFPLQELEICAAYISSLCIYVSILQLLRWYVLRLKTI